MGDNWFVWKTLFWTFVMHDEQRMAMLTTWNKNRYVFLNEKDYAILKSAYENHNPDRIFGLMAVFAHTHVYSV